jgi:hypothetical protein
VIARIPDNEIFPAVSKTPFTLLASCSRRLQVVGQMRL